MDLESLSPLAEESFSFQIPTGGDLLMDENATAFFGSLDASYMPSSTERVEEPKGVVVEPTPRGTRFSQRLQLKTTTGLLAGLTAATPKKSPSKGTPSKIPRKQGSTRKKKTGRVLQDENTADDEADTAPLAPFDATNDFMERKTTPAIVQTIIEEDLSQKSPSKIPRKQRSKKYSLALQDENTADDEADTAPLALFSVINEFMESKPTPTVIQTIIEEDPFKESPSKIPRKQRQTRKKYSQVLLQDENTVDDEAPPAPFGIINDSVESKTAPTIIQPIVEEDPFQESPSKIPRKHRSTRKKKNLAPQDENTADDEVVPALPAPFAVINDSTESKMVPTVMHMIIEEDAPSEPHTKPLFEISAKSPQMNAQNEPRQVSCLFIEIDLHSP